MREIRKRIRKMKKKTFAIPALAAAIPVNPRSAARIATMKNAMAQRSIPNLLLTLFPARPRGPCDVVYGNSGSSSHQEIAPYLVAIASKRGDIQDSPGMFNTFQVCTVRAECSFMRASRTFEMPSSERCLTGIRLRKVE